MSIRLLLAPLALIAAALLAASCGGDGGSAAPVGTAATDIEAAAGFATGPATTVPVGYESPTDHVGSTGAYLPVNGKPTVVFVDAIW